MSESYSLARAAGPQDLEAVADLFRAYASSLPIDLTYQDFAGEVAGLPGAYGPPAGALLLARSADGAPLGCVALRPLDEAGACEMKRMYVAPEARGLGVGRALAEAILGEARGLGYGLMRLDTLPSLTAALGLYAGLGFRRTSAYYDTPVAGTVFLALDLDRQR